MHYSTDKMVHNMTFVTTVVEHCVNIHSARVHCENGKINYVGNEGRKEMFYLTTQSTHFIYGYMASHIW